MYLYVRFCDKVLTVRNLDPETRILVIRLHLEEQTGIPLEKQRLRKYRKDNHMFKEDLEVRFTGVSR